MEYDSIIYCVNLNIYFYNYLKVRERLINEASYIVHHVFKSAGSPG